MDAEAMICDRLALALRRIELAPSYRELLLSVGQDYLRMQFHRFKTYQPPVCLPFLCCEANGVDPLRAIGVTTSWFLLQTAAHVLDKVEDHEPALPGLSPYGQGICTNLSTGMIFVAEWILNHLELDCVDAGAAWDIQRAFHETVLSVCSGQHLDLSVPLPDLATCWEIAHKKSGSAFGLGCYVGARVATNKTDRLLHFDKFGTAVGTIVQISDDLKDLEADGLKQTGNQSLSPMANAYLSHLGLEDQDSGHSESKPKAQTESFQNSLVLYLRLEAMKYAEIGRNELNAISLAKEPHERILKMLNYLSWFGVAVN
ncbi:MAG TPA: polyprenyl synthetase family protein [Anaerolineaceae bacterium]